MTSTINPDLDVNQPQPAPIHIDKGKSAWQAVLWDVDQILNNNRVDLVPFIRDGLALIQLDMAAREEFGIKKYHTTLQVGNGRDTLIDAYQEALDLTVYLRLLFMERQTLPRWHLYQVALDLAIQIGLEVHST